MLVPELVLGLLLQENRATGPDLLAVGGAANGRLAEGGGLDEATTLATSSSEEGGTEESAAAGQGSGWSSADAVVAMVAA